MFVMGGGAPFETAFGFVSTLKQCQLYTTSQQGRQRWWRMVVKIADDCEDDYMIVTMMRVIEEDLRDDRMMTNERCVEPTCLRSPCCSHR